MLDKVSLDSSTASFEGLGGTQKVWGLVSNRKTMQVSRG